MFDPNFDERSFEEQKLWNDPRFGRKVRNQYAERMKKLEAEQNAQNKPATPPGPPQNQIGRLDRSEAGQNISDAMLRISPEDQALRSWQRPFIKPFIYPTERPSPWGQWNSTTQGIGNNLGNLLTDGFDAQQPEPQAPKPNKFGLTRVSPGMYRDSKGNLMTSRDRRFKEIMGNPSSSAVKRQPAVVPRERGQQGE